jgi:hypothetical protein
VTDEARGSRVNGFLVAVVLAVVVAVIGWLALLFVKAVVVLVAYALGVLLVVVPLLTAKRLIGDRTGKARRERIVAIGSAVLLGVGLCVIAHLVSRHGWLLIAVPAAVVLLSRLAEGRKD